MVKYTQNLKEIYSFPDLIRSSQDLTLVSVWTFLLDILGGRSNDQMGNFHLHPRFFPAGLGGCLRLTWEILTLVLCDLSLCRWKSIETIPWKPYVHGFLMTYLRRSFRLLFSKLVGEVGGSMLQLILHIRNLQNKVSLSITFKMRRVLNISCKIILKVYTCNNSGWENSF